MGQSDHVSANIQVKDNAVDPARVIFKTPQGTEYKAHYNAAEQTYQLRVVAGPAGDVQELYALYPAGNGKYWNLGKLGIASYAPQSHKVVLVPVNGTPVDEAAVRQALAAVYGPLGITWQVEKAADYTYTGNGRLMEQSTGLASYNALMQALNGQYQKDRAAGFDKGANYLFFLKATGSGQVNDRSATGFMPRGGQFGYLFTSEIANTDEAVTVAHELGHGRWKLYHTFDGHYGGYRQGQTDNVMDYANGQHLAKWQWDVMGDPAMLVSVFEGDEDAMMVKTGLITDANWVDKNMNRASVLLYGENKMYIKFRVSKSCKGKTVRLKIEELDASVNDNVLEKDYLITQDALELVVSFDYTAELFHKGGEFDTEQQLIFRFFINGALDYQDKSKIIKTHAVIFIPKVMKAKGWIQGERIQAVWFSGSATTYSWDNTPKVDYLDMDWVISAPRMRTVYEDIVANKWKTPNALGELKKQINNMIKDNYVTKPTQENPEVVFGVFDKTIVSKAVEKEEVKSGKVIELMPAIEKYYYQNISYKESPFQEMDDHYATIANCNFRVAAKGVLKYIGENNIEATITHIAIYLKDSLDYVGEDQELGKWNLKENQVIKTMGSDFYDIENKCYQDYRRASNRGGDFYWYSDFKLIDVRKNMIKIKL